MLVDVNLNAVLPPFVINGIQYPPNIESIYTDAELNALGLWRVVDDVVTDPTLTVTGSTLLREDDGTVHRIYQTVPNAVPTTSSIGDAIDAERDRRMYGGFVFNGVIYQTGTMDITNILGAAQLASFAITLSHVAPGNLRWASATTDFTWIAADNSFTPMDAYTVVNFAKSAADFRSTIIYAGRMLKNAVATGQTIDIYADTSWGQNSSSPTSTYLTDPSGQPTS